MTPTQLNPKFLTQYNYFYYPVSPADARGMIGIKIQVGYSTKKDTQKAFIIHAGIKFCNLQYLGDCEVLHRRIQAAADEHCAAYWESQTPALCS